MKLWAEGLARKWLRSVSLVMCLDALLKWGGRGRGNKAGMEGTTISVAMTGADPEGLVLRVLGKGLLRLLLLGGAIGRLVGRCGIAAPSGVGP